ncbi:glutathione S-transferase family protein [Halomonas sp. V046]|uniref:glutathione S-transferase family protein n=1 Tax=Halomonas sp. V046 TaxID=3459611 RepID=UPI0040439EAC
MSAVHIIGPTFSNFVRSVMLTCHEKGIEFDAGMTHGGTRYGLHAPELTTLNPFDKVPVLIHGEHSLFETASICRYLDAEFDGPALQPTDSVQRAQVDQWCAALSTQVDQAIVRRYLLELVFPKGPDGSVREDQVREATPDVARVLAILEQQLGDGDYLVGKTFTLADAIAAPMLDYLVGTPPARGLIDKAPRVEAYVERLRERASGKAVLVAPEFPG